MSADKQSRHGGVPDFGAVAQRPRLTGLISSQSPGLVLVVAPSGHGKSVLAAQYATSKMDNTRVWLDSSRATREPEAVLRALLTTLEPDDGLRAEPPSVLALRSNSEDLVASIAMAVSRLDDPRETVLVPARHKRSWCPGHLLNGARLPRRSFRFRPGRARGFLYPRGS